MRVLKNLLFVFALLVLGMSSCTKIPDPEFTLEMQSPYVNQLADDRFVPYFYVQPTYFANFVIKNARATNGEKTYTLSNIGYGVQTSEGQSDSKLPEGTYTITATSTDGEVSTISRTFNLSPNQIMGEVVVDSLIYSASDNLIKAGWQPVENATAYCLAMTPVVTDTEGNNIEVEPQTQFFYWNENDKKATSGTFRGNENMRGNKYKISVAAFSGTSRPNLVIRKDNHTARIITWGTEPED